MTLSIGATRDLAHALLCVLGDDIEAHPVGSRARNRAWDLFNEMDDTWQLLTIATSLTMQARHVHEVLS